MDINKSLRHDYLYLQGKTRWPIQINVFLSLVARFLMAMSGPVAVLGTPILIYKIFTVGLKNFNAMFVVVVFFSYIYFYFHTIDKQTPWTWRSTVKEFRNAGKTFLAWAREFLSIFAKFAIAVSRRGSIQHFRVTTFGVCRQSPTPPSQLYSIALSDLHISVTKTTTEGKKAVNRELRQFLRKNLPTICGARAVILCGDTTDTGHPLEWIKFCSAIRNFQKKGSRIDWPPILIAPGNHDINITHGGPFSSEDFWKHARNMRLLRFLLAASTLNQELHTADGRLLKDVLEEYGNKIRRYLRDPFNKVDGFQPTDLWNGVFPIYQLIDDRLYIVLDSNRDSSNALTNAIGEIGAEQLDKLDSLIAQRPEQEVHLVLHHHVVPVGRVCPSYVRMNWGGRALNLIADILYSPLNSVRFLGATLYALIFQPHFMRVLDADKLLEKLNHSADKVFVIYHGHRHIRNHSTVSVAGRSSAEKEFLHVLSVPSASLGDEAIPEPNMQYLKVGLNATSLNPVIVS